LKRDSYLPPGFGGYQVSTQGTLPMYRDMRGWNSKETYTINVEGMTVGKTYTVTVTPETGVKTINLLDISGKTMKTSDKAFTYKFTANSAKKQITVVVN